MAVATLPGGRDGVFGRHRRYANLYMMGDPAKGQAGNLEVPPKTLTDYLAFARKASERPGMSAKDNPEVDPDRSRLEQLRNTRRLLFIEVDKLDKALGNTGEVTQPQSALEAAVLSIGVLVEMGEDQVGLVGLRKVDSLYVSGRNTGADRVEVKLELTFFAGDSVTATANLDRYVNTLRSKPWVKEVEPGGSKSLKDNPAENKGIFTEGFKVICDLSKIQRTVAGVGP